MVSKPAPAVWDRLPKTPVLAYFDEITQKERLFFDEIGRLELSLARIEGERQAYQRILELLKPYESDEGTFPCPVCRKPLTASDRLTIIEEIKADIATLNRQAEGIQRERDQLRYQQVAIREQVDTLRELRNRLVHGQLPEQINPNDSFESLLEQTKEATSASPRLSAIDEKLWRSKPAWQS